MSQVALKYLSKCLSLQKQMHESGPQICETYLLLSKVLLVIDLTEDSLTFAKKAKTTLQAYMQRALISKLEASKD